MFSELVFIFADDMHRGDGGHHAGQQKGKGIQHQAGGQLDCGVGSTFAVPDFQHNTDHKAHQQHCANAKQPPH
ncbi:MAG: DUF2563 family protein, partial [Gemmiger sp.]|nr:DUF2563 family protein [Gemmiger sp.]